MTTLRLIHRPESACECGVEVWEVERIDGKTWCSRVCKQRHCNPYWADRVNYKAARKQADEFQAKAKESAA